ncbi:MAG: 2-hydroxyacyl-CoA dehydratase [Candidatus Hydrogenedentota bacterium]|nr:MAG: 2-hydroxyacyl-CoA dehydratase [Candidatus Hydrogenedentota bacterium]
MNWINENVPRRVSYACSYVPEEIILAAGLIPRRMIPEPRISEADAYMHPNTCYYVKSLMASVLAGDSSEIDGIILANSCDGMRRLHDLCKQYRGAIPALFLEVPKKKDPASIEFFASELRRFAGKLEKEFQRSKVTDERLRTAISMCNNVRVLMDEIFNLQRLATSSVRGLSVFDLCLEGTSTPVMEFIEKLKSVISESREGKASDKERRIVVTGNIIHQPDLIALIEDSGARVVAMDTCIGSRHYDGLVKEDSQDPMLALAERYLMRPSCARMEGIEERFQYLKRLVNDSMADGVIYSMVKFCDHHMYEVPLMRNTFEDAGIPFLFIENDYEWAGLEQMRTRVEAFLAMAGERRSQNV